MCEEHDQTLMQEGGHIILANLPNPYSLFIWHIGEYNCNDNKNMGWLQVVDLDMKKVVDIV